MPATPETASTVATCRRCRQNMADSLTTSCTGEDGDLVWAYQSPETAALDGTDPSRRCNDCGLERLGWHHLHCDREFCRDCGDQSIAHYDGACPR